jgi:hypothetical protein
VIAPVVLRRVVGLRRRVAYVVLLAAIILTLLLPFLLVGTDHLLAFVQVTMNRPTWLSLWAVLDGNYQYGATLPIADRFSPENIGVPDASALPWPIIHLVFLAVFLFVVTRRIDWQAPSVSVTFAGLMVNLVLLWSKGFSGQFIANAVPFIVLLAPNLRGAFYTGLLSILWVAEWPIAFLAVDGSAWFITWLVIVRTATLLALSLEHASGMIRNSAQPSPRLASRLTRVSTGILIAGWLTVLPAGIAAVNVYTQTRLDTDPATPALALIQATSGSANRTIVFAVPRLFRRLYPLAHVAGEVWLLPSDRHVPEPHRVTWLNGLAARGPFWFVADEGDPGTHQENLDAEAWVSNQACKVDTQIAGSTRVSRFVSIGDAPIHGSLSAVFADEIELTGYRMSGDALRPGSGWCIELAWRALAAPAGDYTVFVHLVDAQGRVVAQNDMSPQGGFAPTGAWSVGVSLADQHGILLPNDLSAGEYTVQVGLYRSDDQSPVRVTRGERLMPDARGILLAIAHVAP